MIVIRTRLHFPSLYSIEPQTCYMSQKHEVLPLFRLHTFSKLRLTVITQSLHGIK